MPGFDAWGTAGDTLPLMKAVKQQLDPKKHAESGPLCRWHLMEDLTAKQERAQRFRRAPCAFERNH